MIFDFNAFHILTADVQNTIYIRIKKCSGIIVRYGFYFPFIQQKCSFNQCFSISGRAGICNSCSLRKLAVNILNSPDGCSQRAAVIITVKRIQKRTVFTYKCSFCCGGSGIDTEEAVAFIGFQVCSGHIVLALPLIESIIIFLGSKQRFHTGYFKVQLHGVGQPIFHLCHRNGHIFFCIQCRTDSGKKMRVFRYNGVLFVQFECPDKCLFQLRKEMERTSKKGNMSPDRFSAGQTADGLIDNRLENGSRKIFFCCSLVDQGLDI